jgi:hypothetical protein
LIDCINELFDIRHVEYFFFTIDIKINDKYHHSYRSQNVCFSNLNWEAMRSTGGYATYYCSTTLVVVVVVVAVLVLGDLAIYCTTYHVL